MTLTSVKVSKRYQIAVPSEARRALHLHSGDRLIVDIQDGMLLLVPEPENYTRHLAGIQREILGKDHGEIVGQQDLS